MFQVFRSNEYTGESFKTQRAAINRARSLASTYPEYIWQVLENVGQSDERCVWVNVEYV